MHYFYLRQMELQIRLSKTLRKKISQRQTSQNFTLKYETLRLAAPNLFWKHFVIFDEKNQVSES